MTIRSSRDISRPHRQKLLRQILFMKTPHVCHFFQTNRYITLVQLKNRSGASSNNYSMAPAWKLFIILKSCFKIDHFEVSSCILLLIKYRVVYLSLNPDFYQHFTIMNANSPLELQPFVVYLRNRNKYLYIRRFIKHIVILISVIWRKRYGPL